MIKHTGSLNILSFAWSQEKSADVPTWVPDWSKIASKPSLFRDPWNNDHSSKIYTASGDRIPNVEFLEGCGILRTQVYLIGEVNFPAGLPGPGLLKVHRRQPDKLLRRFFEPSGGAYGSIEAVRESYSPDMACRYIE